MMGVLYGVVATALVLTANVAAQAPPQGQGRAGGAPAPPPANLQVLPKDIPRPQLLQTMQAFNQALGVQCNYCQVQEGRGERNDMASDEKPTKKTARQMMVLARLSPGYPSIAST